MNLELVLLDAFLDLIDNRDRMIRRNVVFHLLKAHYAGRGEQSMAVVDLVDCGYRLSGNITDRLAQAGKQATRL